MSNNTLPLKRRVAPVLRDIPGAPGFSGFRAENVGSRHVIGAVEQGGRANPIQIRSPLTIKMDHLNEGLDKLEVALKA